MADGAESTRQLWLDRRHASFEFVDLSTVVAQEVMVVLFSREFIARGLARQLNRDQPFLVNQRFEVPVNRCDADLGHGPLRVGEYLFRRERPIGFDKGGADRVLLAGISRRDGLL